MDDDEKFEEYMKKCWIEEYRDDATPLEKCSNFRRSMISVHNESLERMSNEETRFLLKKNLTKYSQMVEDDSTPNAVNNFAEPLKSIISGKTQTDHCTSWKFELDARDIDVVSMFKESLSNTDSDCNLINCQPSSLSEETLKLIFTKKKDLGTCKFINNVENNQQFTKVSVITKTNLHRSNSIKNTSMNENKNTIFNKNPSFKNPNPPNTSSVDEPKPRLNSFKTAREEYRLQQIKNGKSDDSHQQSQPQKRSLGMTGSGKRKYIPPAMVNSSENASDECLNENVPDERLKHIDPKMVEMIISEILDSGASVSWDDIAGLDFAKTAIQEVVVWPLLRPDIFTGLRRPPRGILLFGPPGTGKTLIAKCIASQCNATFFSISASSLMSKWLGEAEKMVRALFAVARCHQPAVVFIDEIDSLLTQRSDSEHETSRRVKTEFLVQLDGAAIGDEDRFLLIGATNRPQELDEAARRRLVKRLYIPLPDLAARIQIVCRLMNTERHSLTTEDINNVSEMADGFSGADMRSLCAEAALEPIRSIPFAQIADIQRDQVRPVNVDDFKKALTRVRPSVSPNDLEPYIKWDATYGSGSNGLQ